MADTYRTVRQILLVLQYWIGGKFDLLAVVVNRAYGKRNRIVCQRFADVRNSKNIRANGIIGQIIFAL